MGAGRLPAKITHTALTPGAPHAMPYDMLLDARFLPLCKELRYTHDDRVISREEVSRCTQLPNPWALIGSDSPNASYSEKTSATASPLRLKHSTCRSPIRTHSTAHARLIRPTRTPDRAEGRYRAR